MGIYLSNMEMPKKYPVTVTIFPDGVSVVKTISGRRFTATAVPVPPHGRLIDADAFTDLMFADPYQDFIHILGQMPTIIEAEEGK